MAEGKKDDAGEALSLCMCPGCPSWEECGEKGAYCVAGVPKSACIKEEKGCMCGGCGYHSLKGLKHYYFCIKGDEKAQPEKK
jgi:hypothetical protein